MTSEQIQALKARYAEPETPNCRICGAKMSIQRASAGSLVYGCDGRVEGDGYAFKEGRNFADKHYEQSRETVYNMGDADVIALLAERDADKVLIAEQAKRIAELEGALNLASASYAGERERADALQARTLTVKPPFKFLDKSDMTRWENEGIDRCMASIKSACAAAGITLVVEE